VASPAPMKLKGVAGGLSRAASALMVHHTPQRQRVGRRSMTIGPEQIRRLTSDTYLASIRLLHSLLPNGMMAQRELTRRAMYDLVWSRPMTKVAEEFGISDVALKKACAKHRIPTPPRGYWARKAAGKSVKQLLFHEISDHRLERIVIYGVRNNLPSEVTKVLEQEEARRRAKPRPTQTIASTLSMPVSEVHQQIAATAKALRKAKPDKEGVVKATGDGLCGVIVGAAVVERVIRVLDSLGRALEQRGLTLEPAGSGMKVTVGPDSVTLFLTERVEKQKHVPTLEELAAEERRTKKRERDSRLGIWTFEAERTYPEFDQVRTGALSIQIADQYVRGLRRTWNEGTRQRLEDLVEEVAGGIVAYLAGVKAQREERERWHREWKRKEELRALAIARSRREEKRWAFIKKCASTTAQADDIRALLNHWRPLTVARDADALARMILWLEENLAALERQITPESVASGLEEENLFPERDDLANG
jgi:hypothetical protein